MRLQFRALSLLLCLACLLAVTATSYAQITSATVYLGIPDPGNAGDLAANTASTLMSAQFNIGSLGVNFVSTGTYDVSSFLNHPTFFNMQNGFTNTVASTAGSADNLELVLVGQTFLNSGLNSFVVGHDDGVVVTMPGLPGGFGNVLNQPGPTGFVSTPFNVNNTGAAGEFSFTLDYAECCGPPADLLFTVNGAPITSGAAPEPNSFVLLGTGLVAFAGMVRRRIFA